MVFNRGMGRAMLMAACVVLPTWAASAWAQAAGASGAASVVTLRGVSYEHRWSKDGQNEFTPKGQADLASWTDMVTVNVHDGVSSGEQLADMANKVLSNYQRNGKVLRTDSKARTAERAAEHLIVAVLGAPDFLEVAFARFLLLDGKGVVAVYSHRVYGKPAGPAMSDWLNANGAQVEKDLMAWKTVPAPAALARLPQSR